MDQIGLDVTTREILGKKVRFLRRQGVTPVHIFGHGIDSVPLQSDTTSLRRVLAEAGQTRLISLRVNNEKTPRNVIVREIQREPLTGETLHVDFYEVRMSEQIKMEVPVILVGEAPALKSKENMLVHELSTLMVECLPACIPSSIEVDIRSLTEPEQVVRVKDIQVDKEVTILNNPEQSVVRISLRPKEKVEEVAAVEAAAVEAPEAAAAPEESSKEE